MAAAYDWLAHAAGRGTSAGAGEIHGPTTATPVTTTDATSELPAAHRQPFIDPPIVCPASRAVVLGLVADPRHRVTGRHRCDLLHRGCGVVPLGHREALR